MRAGLRTLVTAVALLACAHPRAGHAQGFLDEFTSEGLRLSGFGVDFGGAWSDRLDAALSASVRADAGFVAPRIRPLLGVSVLAVSAVDPRSLLAHDHVLATVGAVRMLEEKLS